MAFLITHGARNKKLCFFVPAASADIELIELSITEYLILPIGINVSGCRGILPAGRIASSITGETRFESGYGSRIRQSQLWPSCSQCFCICPRFVEKCNILFSVQ